MSQTNSSFCRAKPLEFYLEQLSNGDRWGGETGSKLWNTSSVPPETETVLVNLKYPEALQTFSVHPDSYPFLRFFSSSREWSFPTLLESLFSFRPFSFVQPDFILKNCWQKWENCSGKSRNPPLAPFTATYFLNWSWVSLCFRPPSQVSSLRRLEDTWSCVSRSGYFWLEPLQVFF